MRIPTNEIEREFFYRDLIEKGGSLPESSTPAGLGQVIAQTVDDVVDTIREFGMQQE